MSLPHRCAESDPGSRADVADTLLHSLLIPGCANPVRSRKRGAPNFDSQLNTITPLWSLALIGSASGRFWARAGSRIRGVFDEETRRKPLVFAADAVRYGI